MSIRSAVLFSFSLTVLFFSTSSRAQAPRPLITQSIDESRRITLKGNTHPLARPQFDIGVAAPDAPMRRMLMVLKRSPEQEHALIKLLDDQQDKTSPNYHKWLTPNEFGRQFGPADQDLQAVTGWLQSHGFQVNRVTHGRSFIEFSGVEAKVEEALHTQIHKYLVNGEEHWANATDPQIPAALTPVVAGVWTLHNFVKKPHIKLSKLPVSFTARAGEKPQVTFPDPPHPAIHALGPQDYATIYNINPVYQSGINGSGITIGVVARSDLFSFFDVTDFRSLFGLCCGNVSVINDGPDPGDLGGVEEAEATLDVTWSGAIAPGATIDMVISATTNTTDGVDLSELYIIDNNLADIMTESFGSCEVFATQDEAAGLSMLAEQAAAQGISYMASTGDNGAEGCVNPAQPSAQGQAVSVSVVASTPFNVAVGGTMFNENGQDSKYWGTAQPVTETALSYIPENVWNESCSVAQCGAQHANLAAGSGGASIFNAKPSWQSGVAGIPSDGARDIPDVSLTAAFHDPYLLCIEQSCEQGFIFFISGTSASAPSFAGIMGLVDQNMAQLNSGNGRQGLPNYVLYRLAATETLSQCNGSKTSGLPAQNCVFNDVTVGNNAVPGELNYGTATAQYQAGTGYDLSSGLGSVNVQNLVTKWNSVGFTTTTTTLTLTPTTITHGQAIDVSVAVTGSGGVPTGSITLLTSLGQSVGVYPLDASGKFTGQVRVFPAGIYTVTARYSGDANFAASTSDPSPQLDIAEENSVTTVSVFTVDANGNAIPFSSGPYGTFVYLRADVKSQSGFGIPSGGPNFFIDNGTSLPDAVFRTLNSLGYWTLGFTNFAIGQHAIQAEYQGQGYLPSTSAPVDFTLSQATTTLTLTSTPETQGANFAATINTNGGGAPPTGTITFTLDNQQLGPITTFAPTFAQVNPQFGILEPAGASATFLQTTISNGQHVLSAQYSGDANYSGSSSTLSFGLQPDFAIGITSTNVLMVTAPGLSASTTLQMTDLDGFTGAVSFSCTGLPSESKCSFTPASLSSNGTTTLTVTTTQKTGMLTPNFGQEHRSLAIAFLGLPLFGVVFLPMTGLRRRLLNLILLSALLAAGCGGGSSERNNGPPPNPGTPIGTSTVTIVASSGNVSHSTTFTLVVQ